MIVFYVILAFVLLLLLWIVWTYNGLVKKRNMKNEAWSGMDVQLKRRSDLVPNLVTVVKGYADHERESFEEVTRLRGLAQTQHDVAGTEKAENQLSGAMAKIFAIAENYPDLKASEQFLGLQQALQDIEEHIQYARRYYNGTVRELNIMIESVPSNLVAKFFRFEKGTFFEMESIADRIAPVVSFS